MGFLEGFKQGLSGVKKYEMAGKKVICLHCQGEEFDMGRAQLNTAGLTFLDFDWANRSANTLICLNCGRIEWFLKKPTPLN